MCLYRVSEDKHVVITADLSRFAILVVSFDIEWHTVLRAQLYTALIHGTASSYSLQHSLYFLPSKVTWHQNDTHDPPGVTHSHGVHHR